MLNLSLYLPPFRSVQFNSILTEKYNNCCVRELLIFIAKFYVKVTYNHIINFDTTLSYEYTNELYLFIFKI